MLLSAAVRASRLRVAHVHVRHAATRRKKVTAMELMRMRAAPRRCGACVQTEAPPSLLLAPSTVRTLLDHRPQRIAMVTGTRRRSTSSSRASTCCSAATAWAWWRAGGASGARRGTPKGRFVRLAGSLAG